MALEFSAAAPSARTGFPRAARLINCRHERTDLDPAYDPRSDGAMRASGAKLVRPRDAATLIIVRRDAAKPRLLMGRRHGGHDFMPDKWVFPGGRIDRSDFRAPYASDLRPESLAGWKRPRPMPAAAPWP